MGIRFILAWSLVTMLAARASAEPVKTLALTRSGKAACKVVIAAGKRPEPLMLRAAQAITDTVERWGSVRLPVAAIAADDGLPASRAIVLATLDRLRKLDPSLERSQGEIMRVGFIEPDGFACVPIAGKRGLNVLVVARTPRGVYNGAVYLRDFCIDGTADDLALRLEPTVRSPQMRGRAVYLLTIWGNEPHYTVQDWMTALDSFARDGMDRVYFWTSGHFPSRRFPQTYACDDHGFDSTVGTRIGTLKDLRALIRYSHDLGLKFYLGSGLGGWCGTGMITNGDPATQKQGSGMASKSLCPSNERVRKSLVEYYQEEFDALPEADGMYIELADEWGECTCPLCHRALDEYGSRQFGQSQLSLVQEIAREIWRDHPQARFALTVGYDEHKSDPLFYEVMRQMSDPRFEWMEARDSWEFPGPGGKPMRASYFSPQVMRWRPYVAHPMERIVADANRIAAVGMYGSIIEFSPGFNSGSFYRTIPFPTDILPSVLTGFVFREATWEPTLSVDDMRERVQRRFFGAEAPRQLADDLWALREIIRTSAAQGLSPQQRTQLGEIELRVADAEPNASPKTLEGLSLITRAIGDTRRHAEASATE